MARTKPSFVVELPPQTTAADERGCAITLDAARNINAALDEALVAADGKSQRARCA